MRERVISKRIDDFSRSARNLTLETKRRFFFAYKIDMNENVCIFYYELAFATFKCSSGH